MHFIKHLATRCADQENVRIEGGERIRDVQVTSVASVRSARRRRLAPTVPGERLRRVAEPGDFSTYTLRLVQDAAAR